MINKIIDGNFTPKKPIFSRYSICNINSNKYSTIPIYSGNTHISSGHNDPGIIFVPYIMVNEINDESMAKIMRNERRKKLERLLSDL